MIKVWVEFPYSEDAPQHEWPQYQELLNEFKSAYRATDVITLDPETVPMCIVNELAWIGPNKCFQTFVSSDQDFDELQRFIYDYAFNMPVINKVEFKEQFVYVYLGQFG